jgi:hypothetical protein
MKGENRRMVWRRRPVLLLLVVLTALLSLVPSASALTLGVGWSGNPPNNNIEMPLVGKSGAETFRTPMGGGFGHLAEDDTWVENAAKANVTIHAEVSTSLTSLPTEHARAEFLEWVSFAVERWGYGGDFWYEPAHASLPYRPITTWEIGNEPNQNGIDPVVYGKYLSQVADTIQTASQKKAQRFTDVLFAGILANENTGTGKASLQGALQYLTDAYPYFGFNPNVKGVAIHPYENDASRFINGPSTTRVGAFKFAVEEFRKKLVLLANGGPVKSIWVTEAGWPAKNQYGIGEAEQANSLRQVVDYLREKESSMNIKSLVWYNFRDTGSPLWDWHNWCGLRADDHFRQAWTAFQEKTGVPLSIPQAPAVGTSPPISVDGVQATLTGAVNPRGLPTNYYFEWGTSTAYGSSTLVESAGSGEEGIAEGSRVTVQPHTLYHYRIVASNAVGVSYGSDQTFRSGSIGVFFSDGSRGNTMSRWNRNSSTGWQQEFLNGDALAAGTKPAAMYSNGKIHVFYVDAAKNNTIADWVWSENGGWKQTFLFGDRVAAETSPTVTTDNGVIHVFFVDAAKGNTIADWSWSEASGWNQIFLYGDPVAAGSSPTVISEGGAKHLFFVNAAKGNTITDWEWSPSTLRQVFLYGDPVAAGSSPTVISEGGAKHLFFVNAAKGNTITDWEWSPSTLRQVFLYGDPVAAGSSPSGF